MAHILILGGGFGGVMAAERLARSLTMAEHHITLVSRSRRFTFYPALVRLAFGRCEPDDISYDLRDAMLDRRVRFVEAEVAAANLVAELEGQEPAATYEHEMLLVVEAGRDSAYLRKKLWEAGEQQVSWGWFWSWAKRAHEGYWQAKHS